MLLRNLFLKLFDWIITVKNSFWRLENLPLFKKISYFVAFEFRVLGRVCLNSASSLLLKISSKSVWKPQRGCFSPMTRVGSSCRMLTGPSSSSYSGSSLTPTGDCFRVGGANCGGSPQKLPQSRTRQVQYEAAPQYEYGPPARRRRQRPAIELVDDYEGASSAENEDISYDCIDCESNQDQSDQSYVPIQQNRANQNRYQTQNQNGYQNQNQRNGYQEQQDSLRSRGWSNWSSWGSKEGCSYFYFIILLNNSYFYLMDNFSSFLHFLFLSHQFWNLKQNVRKHFRISFIVINFICFNFYSKQKKYSIPFEKTFCTNFWLFSSPTLWKLFKFRRLLA